MLKLLRVGDASRSIGASAARETPAGTKQTTVCLRTPSDVGRASSPQGRGEPLSAHCQPALRQRLLAVAVARLIASINRRTIMGDQKNQNPNYGSDQGRKDEEQKNPNERAGQRGDQEQPGKGQGGQSGDRDRASNPQGGSDAERNRQFNSGKQNERD